MEIRVLLGMLNTDKRIIPMFICALVISQLATILPTAYQPDPEPDYKYFIIPYVKQCSITEYPQRQLYVPDHNGIPKYIDGTAPTRDPLKWWVNCLSYKTTGSAKLIPIFFNIGIIPLTYLLAVSLTKNRMLGLIAAMALVYNPMYTRFEGSGTYDQIWAFFLLLSALFVFRIKDRIALSVPFFLLSLAAKALGILYLPALFYTILKSDRPRRIKWITILCMIGIIATIGMVSGSKIMGGSIEIHPENLETAVSQSIKMVWDVLPVLIIAVGINRWLVPKNKVANKDIVGSWMICGFMTTSLIYIFTNQLQFVYRFVPFVTFMSIYLGIVIVETGNKLLERKLSYKNKLV